MKINDVICHDLIQLNLQGSSKSEVLAELACMLHHCNRISNIATFLEDINTREKLGTTYIGNLIAIPHGQSATVEQVSIAIGKTVSPIDWNASEESTVQYIVLFAIPDIEDPSHFFSILSYVIELFITPLFLAELSTVNTPDKFLELLNGKIK